MVMKQHLSWKTVIKALYQQNSIKLKKYGSTPLHAAINNGRQDIGGSTPLHIAARDGHQDIVSILIVAGADLNQADKDGSTPLYIATRAGHHDILSTLIAARANVNKADKTSLYSCQ
ncbi:hypothetical protein THRCLA_23276 [Thraustotheca clavata]|uniref:Uncharacterized protein n=1 Tax=Thraustotheca clavata TaxID=74557 RepID=A0A1V9Y866_9STRA|nr:hypothetical protein THRCLA_23276 [Thraustotheca clavata]